MKNFIVLFSIILLSACATPTPIPQDVKDKVAQISTDDLPRNSSLEQTRCPKSRYRSFDKHMDCKISVRRELAARQMMREQNTAIEESKNETIKN
ncbi:MAG TPA: hypothetical protein DEA55_01755 [Rhodospirillaceae bacterium]|nr:hypothetical protein [Rhodospirillaceae bacterium]